MSTEDRSVDLNEINQKLSISLERARSEMTMIKAENSRMHNEISILQQYSPIQRERDISVSKLSALQDCYETRNFRLQQLAEQSQKFVQHISLYFKRKIDLDAINTTKDKLENLLSELEAEGSCKLHLNYRRSDFKQKQDPVVLEQKLIEARENYDRAESHRKQLETKLSTFFAEKVSQNRRSLLDQEEGQAQMEAMFIGLNKKFDQTNRQVDVDIDRISGQVSMIIRRFTILQRKYRQLLSQSNDKDDIYNDWQTLVRDNQKEITKMQLKDETNQERIASLELKLQQAERKSKTSETSGEDKISTLEFELAQAEACIQESNQAFEDEIVAHQKRNKSLQAEVNELTDKLEELSTDNDQLQRKLNNLAKQHAEANEKLNSVRASQIENTTDFKTELELLKNANESLRDQNTTLKQTLQDVNTAQKRNKAKTTSQMEDLRSRLRQSSEFSSSKEQQMMLELEQKEQAMKELIREKEQLQKKFNSGEKAVANLCKENDDLQKQVKSAIDELTKLEQQSATQAGTVPKLNTEIKEAKSQIHQLQDQLKDKENIITTQKLAIESLKQELDDSTDCEKCTSANEQILELKAQLQKAHLRREDCQNCKILEERLANQRFRSKSVSLVCEKWGALNEEIYDLKTRMKDNQRQIEQLALVKKMLSSYSEEQNVILALQGIIKKLEDKKQEAAVCAVKEQDSFSETIEDALHVFDFSSRSNSQKEINISFPTIFSPIDDKKTSMFQESKIATPEPPKTNRYEETKLKKQLEVKNKEVEKLRAQQNTPPREGIELNLQHFKEIFVKFSISLPAKLSKEAASYLGVIYSMLQIPNNEQKQLQKLREKKSAEAGFFGILNM